MLIFWLFLVLSGTSWLRRSLLRYTAKTAKTCKSALRCGSAHLSHRWHAGLWMFLHAFCLPDALELCLGARYYLYTSYFIHWRSTSSGGLYHHLCADWPIDPTAAGPSVLPCSRPAASLRLRLMRLLHFLYSFIYLFSRVIAFFRHSLFSIPFQKSNYGSTKQSIIEMKSTAEEN